MFYTLNDEHCECAHGSEIYPPHPITCASKEELALMNTAMLLERERCAKIAERVADEDRSDPGYNAAMAVAEEIRKGE